MTWGYRLPGRSHNSSNHISTAVRARRGLAAPRTGVAAVEFALVAPLLFFVILVIVELGRGIMVQQILTNASREGARRGILEQATVSDVETAVADYLNNTSISGASVSVSPDPLDSAGFGDPVTVSCSVTYAQVSWLPAPWFLGGKTLMGQSVMGAERLE